MLVCASYLTQFQLGGDLLTLYHASMILSVFVSSGEKSAILPRFSNYQVHNGVRPTRKQCYRRQQRQQCPVLLQQEDQIKTARR